MTAGAAGLGLRAFRPDGPVIFEHGQNRMISIGFHVEPLNCRAPAGMADAYDVHHEMVARRDSLRNMRPEAVEWRAGLAARDE